MGFCYLLGFGVAKDEQKAIEYYGCAAANGELHSES
jgi:TPR repeat protein